MSFGLDLHMRSHPHVTTSLWIKENLHFAIIPLIALVIFATAARPLFSAQVWKAKVALWGVAATVLLWGIAYLGPEKHAFATVISVIAGLMIFTMAALGERKQQNNADQHKVAV
ncbi:hypothetical protein P4N68_11650 [Corynebacterium felinum]|uniref:hypothetical protein n=1 Tax=Corynebacterium felinum TaxID=131318 RepID=UPI0023F6323C|nr:hypothetical protein [Corynebacterium felinum]MDF5821724.1 hypothetical protein [Corynebacterium felinum]